MEIVYEKKNEELYTGQIVIFRNELYNIPYILIEQNVPTKEHGSIGAVNLDTGELEVKISSSCLFEDVIRIILESASPSYIDYIVKDSKDVKLIIK